MILSLASYTPRTNSSTALFCPSHFLKVLTAIILLRCNACHGFQQIRERSSRSLLAQISRGLGWNVFNIGYYKPSAVLGHSLSAAEIKAQFTELDNLLSAAGINVDSSDVSIETISGVAAFCNKTFRITIGENRLIAKLFSPLALRRMNPAVKVGEVDRTVAKLGISPPIVTATNAGILMEECMGRTLCEDDMHGEDTSYCVMAAEALARLHGCNAMSDSSKFRENMLWRSCDISLAICEENEHSRKGARVKRLKQLIQKHRATIERRLPMTVLFGHGDCKPSNIIITAGSAKFIDLEITGVHYVAYDLAKLMRTKFATPWTDRNKQFLYETYLQSTEFRKPTLEQLYTEVDLLLPLTWLEAAIFFEAMAYEDPDDRESWTTLASDRIECYENVTAG